MKKIALTWGWTWGHTMPLLAVYNYLKKDENLEFVWFWDEDSLEEKIALENNIVFKYIPSGKIRRYFDLRNFYEPLKNLSWIVFGIYYLLALKVDIVFSKWWFVSLPLCIAAFILRKKIYIHESDTIWWLANKIIWKIATKIFYSFENELIDDKKHILTGQILNPELLNKVRKNEDLEENEELEVLVIAWSQGSTRIFESVKSILNNLIDVNFTIILWDKNLHFRKEFENFSNVRIYDFATQEDLWVIYKNTDIAITRAWATTLWELYFFGIHSIIVPLKESASNHQEENWKYFKENFWSDLLEESEKLNLDIYRLISKYKDLRKDKLNLKHFFYPLEKIKEEILN